MSSVPSRGLGRHELVAILGDDLSIQFHQLFVVGLEDQERKKEKKKQKKKKKKNSKVKAKGKDKNTEESSDVSVPSIECQGNASSFAVYCEVRKIVLEHEAQKTAQAYTQSSQGKQADSDTEDEAEEKKENLLKIPKIVGIGLCGVFELIKETKDTQPTLCTRVLQALLDMLQGQQPEGLKNEPHLVIESLFKLLMELATMSTSRSKDLQCESLTSLACACLLSLIISRGDTGKMLTAVAAMLMSPLSLSSQQVKVPQILTSLQKCVHAVLLGKTILPDWLSQGIKESARSDTIHVPDLGCTGDEMYSCVASDGTYMYIHNINGLHKVGSGYGGTIKGHLYLSNHHFHPGEDGWLGYAKNKLFYKNLAHTDAAVTLVLRDSLQEGGSFVVEGEERGTYVMFSDGDNLGHIAAAKDDSFVVRTFSATHNPMPLMAEIPLKLARKCLDVVGTANFDSKLDIHSINTETEEEPVNIGAGKDFALIRTSSGKILYSGRSQSLGIKQGGPLPDKWAELNITKSPKIASFAVGHEGGHALLMTEDGAVFFVGTAKRGEDGDNSLAKNRRQPKAVKPKKLIKMEGIHVVQAACNSGSSALVTKSGELYIFGKDSVHCDISNGQVTDLKGIEIVQVALGKAHGVVLTKKGLVYSFGINNKGQCGREYMASASREMSAVVTMVDEEEEATEEEIMCPPGNHKWKHDLCMVCTNCGECTGYGASCISASSMARNPGMPCGCGSGDSGCQVCGVCRSCAGESSTDEEKVVLEAALAYAKNKDIDLDDLFLAGSNVLMAGGLNPEVAISKLTKAHRQKYSSRGMLKSKAKNNSSTDTVVAGEYDPEHVKMNSLSPAKLDVGVDIPVTQIACGLQHTVLLLETGDVYTFGSNQYGQLGIGDTNIKGAPTKVPIKFKIVQIAAGSHHTALLTSAGQVYTFGDHQKGALGRPSPPEDKIKDKRGHWYALPGAIPGIGAKHGRRATWISASGDQTYIRIDELLINGHTLARSCIIANHTCIGLIPTTESGSTIRCLMINKSDGSCKSFTGPEQASLYHHSLCLDPVFDMLWSYNSREKNIQCFNVISCEVRNLHKNKPAVTDITNPELTVPTRTDTVSNRSHTALHLLGCLDTLTSAQQLGMTVFEEEKEKQQTTKVYTKEDFTPVNRFESHGGGWGYSGHSIEAIRFTADCDVLVGGLGLFGGRGEYLGKIQIYELGPEAAGEPDGELLAETEETPYECGVREKFHMLFEEPILCQANHWYVALSRIQGPSSDCGSIGQTTVTTEDQVVFKFKNSKKSNNGTDVNAGQIPQLLYRLPNHDSSTTYRGSEHVEPAHILSKDFSMAVSPECFESLLKLLQWSWNTFCAAVMEVLELRGMSLTAALLDLERLVYISMASLRLIKIYICQVFPVTGSAKSAQSESTKMAECVGDTRSLLRKVLAENKASFLPNPKARDNSIPDPFNKMADDILKECHVTFTGCFHAFYPTSSLKWNCLCELLGFIEPGQSNIDGYSRLLSAVMEALCKPFIKLTNVMPINCEHEAEIILKKQYSPDDNTASNVNTGDSLHFPLLVDHMTVRLDGDVRASPGHWNFKEVVEKLLSIVVVPVRQKFNQETVTYPANLISNTCSLLAALVNELAATATGSETEVMGSNRPLLNTPNRFSRCSQSAYWNTGNGSPDAVCFSVDKSGVMIAGACVYGGGGGQYEYDLELLDEVKPGEGTPDVSGHTGRWNSLELVKGTFVPEDCQKDIAEIRFDKPVPIKENTKYAMRLRNRGPRTLNGDGGQLQIKCPDGATFTFSACSLSNNGTNHCRGQIPQILYYSAPQDGENQMQNSKVLAEFQARKNAITVVSNITRAATDLLHRANVTETGMDNILAESHIINKLLPMVIAHISPVAAMDPRSAVQVLGLVQDLLPPISALNSITAALASPASPTPTNGDIQLNGENNTTSQHYAVVESDHPYKQANVANYKVTFPESVRWMILEFDPLCGTAQIEDTLQLYIPSRHPPESPQINLDPSIDEDCNWIPVLKRFHGTSNWPGMAVILPGNKLIFSLETASDYVKDEKACFYGFKCLVVGYELAKKTKEGLLELEKEIGSLGGMCAATLMKKDIVLPPMSLDEGEDEYEAADEAAQLVFTQHASLLKKGFALSQQLSITQALDGNLPFSCASNERTFLKDFVNCTPGTSGGRLAAWLQPEPYLDTKMCDITYTKSDLKCSWPTVITVHTKDQYGNVVHVPKLKVEVKAVPIIKDTMERKKRSSRYGSDWTMVFGGHPPPKLDVPYEPSVKERKDMYHSICMMKAYENYSFEELRYASPPVHHPIENMLVRENNDGSYSCSWTPSSVGWYNIHVSLDSYQVGEVFKVQVKEPPQRLTAAPQHNQPQSGQRGQGAYKSRKFVGENSAGLRIRVNPSLQSEQIGIIPPKGHISFISEFHNDDGVWVRLTPDSMKKWCTVTNGYSEAWALQYNQHLGKTLLVAVEEPKSLVDEIIKDSIRRSRAAENKPSTKGPGVYTVVKCGSSGHNIRSRPTVKASAVGKIIMSMEVYADDDLVNSEGHWIKLDEASCQAYCHDQEGEAWILASGIDGIVYLKHSTEMDESKVKDTAVHSTTKGFDFSSAAQQVPSFPAFGQEFQSFGDGHFVFGSPDSKPCPTHWAPFKEDEGSSHKSHTTTNSITPSPPTGSAISAPAPPERKDSLAREFTKDISRDIPPELHGVSVKDLVRALGESRVNGNGATPPRTPPGTPKKTGSRGSSPRAIPGSPRGFNSPKSSPQPVRKDYLGSSPLASGSPPLTPPRTPPPPRRLSDSSRPSHDSSRPALPPKTPPSQRKDLSAMGLSAIKSPQRSLSHSPQRSGSPVHTPLRQSSHSPGRAVQGSDSKRFSSDSVKPHFNIGLCTGEDIRVSPKPSRKERSKALRSKRERAISPVNKDKHRSTRLSAGIKYEVTKAMSPSVSQCLRSVFAAYMWHEGIVHDAMACASFLKFHPNLVKEIPIEKIDKDGTGSRKGTPNSSKKGTPNGSLKKHSRQSSDKGGEALYVNINEAVKKMEQTKKMERSKKAEQSRSRGHTMTDGIVGDVVNKTKEDGNSSKTSSLDRKESELPKTLLNLVYFWEELSLTTKKIIDQNLVIPSPTSSLKLKRSEKKNREKDKERKSKKKKADVKVAAAAAAAGNVFADGPVGIACADRETMCELCGGLFSHPVTYHMRQAHPGCGRLAGGQGYNSGGNFCGGWAGNCGDGGKAGSTWYLMCEKCREKYLREKRQGIKDKTKKVKKKTPSTSKETSLPETIEPHTVLSKNAMFLLELASSSKLALPSNVKQTQSNRNNSEGMLPSVNEDTTCGTNSFPTIPFQYLSLRGAPAADSVFAEELILSDDGEIMVGKGLKRGQDDKGRGRAQIYGRRGRGNSEGGHLVKVQRSVSAVVDANFSPQAMCETPPPITRSAETSPIDNNSAGATRMLFQRSVSEIGANALQNESCEDVPLNEGNNRVVLRRRNNSGGITDGGMSLLKHPSAAMTRLIQSKEKQSSLKKDPYERALCKPVMSFVMQRHDLDSLQLAMKQALRKAACRVFALQAFNWLVRSVTQPTALHDLLWYFVSSLVTPPVSEPDNNEEGASEVKDEEKKEKVQKSKPRPSDGDILCEHPLVDIGIAGEAVQPLPQAFHTFLQTVSDVMMYLPPGSALQQMAVRCWCLRFRSSDHVFLHGSHVFSNISKILSKSDEGWGHAAELVKASSHVDGLVDITQTAEFKASTRQAMIASLTDNSTETFWESGDEDRNKTKTITITCAEGQLPHTIYVHVDNSRDLANKVMNIVFSAGINATELTRVQSCDLENRHIGWVTCTIPDPTLSVIKLELKGPDNSLRVRQVKVLGELKGSGPLAYKQLSPLVMQQQNCELETLRVFRLLTSQVFGRLIQDNEPGDEYKESRPEVDISAGDLDLKEHMVGILFSRSKLTHLQKQVCSHIVQAIRKETYSVQETWEQNIKRGKFEPTSEEADVYCFELLSMVLALSGSGVGRVYLAQQHSLLQDLLQLLHIASPRVQRQVISLLRRVLPEVTPPRLATLMGVAALPPKDLSVLSTASKESEFDPDRLGILDVFLACIAKALTVQSKVKVIKSPSGNKGTNSYRIGDCISQDSNLGARWWLKGTMSTKLAKSIIDLLKDLAAGKLSESWASVTKGAVAEAILALTKLNESTREPSLCIKTPTLWLSLASLCVLEQEHVERLSSGHWITTNGDHNQDRPSCDNHDDGETLAIIQCTECGNLCADCDRFLHLHRKTRSHQRQVFKEEEESIKVDLHEGCGRTKLFWVMALADSKTLKAMVEFRDGAKAKLGGSGSMGTCRFCGSVASSGILALGNVCSDPDCQEYGNTCCSKTLACGHACMGTKGEEPCLPCLHGCGARLRQDADDMCMICFTEALVEAPCIQLQCGHIFHFHCCNRVLDNKWVGPRITFGFSLCPICKCGIDHSALKPLLDPIRNLFDDVKKKALMRLEYEGLTKSEAVTTIGARFYQDPAGFAMERYAYYVCFKCKRAYYGGKAECEEQAGGGDDYDPSELLCGGCSDVSRAQMCAKHGADFLEYKCRYCCSVAVFFCFGTTHFCNACHDDFQRVTNIAKSELPHCPAGPRAKQLDGTECPLHVEHPPTGEECALGCGVCRNAHTF